MTTVEKMARAIVGVYNSRRFPGHPDRPNPEPVDYAAARAALTAFRDAFADPVVRAAIQHALDEKDLGEI